MPDPFRNYDAWLEAPFQRAQNVAASEQEAFEAWCETNERDQAEPDAWEDFVEAMEAEDEDRALQAAEERAERQLDRELDERYG